MLTVITLSASIQAPLPQVSYTKVSLKHKIPLRNILTTQFIFKPKNSHLLVLSFSGN